MLAALSNEKFAVMTPRDIKIQRAMAAWNQRDLAEAAGISVQTVKDVERGAVTPKEETVRKIKTALDAKLR